MIAKALQIPLDEKIDTLHDIPWTISFVLRKRIQVDNLNELPKDKRPPDRLIWMGTPEEIDDFLDRAWGKTKREPESVFVNLKEIE